MLKEDVSSIMQHGRVALIECSLQEAAKIHRGYHVTNHPCHYIYLAPPSATELANRLIRTHSEGETKQSIRQKQNRMEQDCAMVRGLDWMDHRFVSDGPNQLIKEVPTYLMHQLYGSTSKSDEPTF